MSHRTFLSYVLVGTTRWDRTASQHPPCHIPSVAQHAGCPWNALRAANRPPPCAQGAPTRTSDQKPTCLAAPGTSWLRTKTQMAAVLAHIVRGACHRYRAQGLAVGTTQGLGFRDRSRLGSGPLTAWAPGPLAGCCRGRSQPGCELSRLGPAPDMINGRETRSLPGRVALHVERRGSGGVSPRRDP